MKGSRHPAPGSREGPETEVLYESATTRVFRRAGSAAIFKQAIGADATIRLRHEELMLRRLAGVEGVARLAAGSQPSGMLALQDLGGAPLARQLLSGPLEAGALMMLAPKLARSVAAMHRAGVIHRDINPANILLAADGEPVMIDFGLAMAADQQASARESGIVGTLGYLAPEQTGRTGRAVDQRADLYALGATLYEAATGRPPFEEPDTLKLIHDHLVREPVAPSARNGHVPGPLSDIILRLLAKAPEQRYQSAEGLLHDLARLEEALAEGKSGAFELGERDFAARLEPPAGLIGRDAETAVLRAALAEAMDSPRRVVLIEGAAGVGKSALMNELKPMVAAAGGWFVQGKFDQHQKDAAADGPFLQALKSLGRLLLASPKEDVAAYRRRILDASGRQAGLIARLSPEFTLLLGEQPAVPEVDPRQAELRLQQVFVDLLDAIASPAQPLVIVLDDLQWASALSLRTFERLMVEPRLRGLMLVGAYRGEELDAGHALTAMLARWQRHRDAPVRLALSNLSPAGVGELVARMLRLEPGPALALARAVGELTGGNPFDTVEMINALRREGVLRLDPRGWHWEEAAIRHFVGRGNVVDLLSARIARLPAGSRDLLAFMACLGNAVEGRLLAAATGIEETELDERLRPPVEDGLLLAPASEPKTWQFRHDRVQQAVLRAMEGDELAGRQMAMARRLARVAGFEDEAAQQYLAGIEAGQVLQDSAERRDAAAKFHVLARKLAAAATYALAERYLAAAAALLSGLDEPADAPLRAAVDVARHAALYNLGRLDECDWVYAAIQARTADALQLVEPACLQMRTLDMRGRLQDSIRLARGLLAKLGLAIRDDYADPATEQRLDALRAWVAEDGRLDHAKRPRMEDPRLLAVAKLLGRMVRSAYYLEDMEAYAWLLLESQRLWSLHGPCAELVATLARMGGMLVARRQDYRAAFEIGRHVISVGEALGYEPQTSEARGIFAAYSSFWLEPLAAAHGHASRAYEGVLAGGEISYSCFVHRVASVVLVDTAPTIEACAAEVDAGMALCERTGNQHAAALYACERQVLRALRGMTRSPDSFDDEQFDEEAFTSRMADIPYAGVSYHTRRAMHSALMGDLEALGRHAAAAMSMLGAIPGYPMTVDARLYTALANAWHLQRRAESGTQGSEDEAMRRELASCRAWLAERAADQPYNFLHLARLVEAEEAWALGDAWKAARAFDEALAEAETRERPWHRALIAERAALFQLARGLSHSGRRLLARARDHYQDWGASAKVARLQRDHPGLPVLVRSPVRETLAAATMGPSLRGSNSVSSDALDLLGVLRASQALSSETSLERLVSRVTEVLAGLSGATKVLVLTWLGEQWWLLGSQPGEAPISLPEAAGRGLLPASAVGYAERTAEALVVDDAVTDDRFARDPYFAGVAFCSLLVAPIASQGTTRAMLLLENRQGRAAFNGERLDAVMLIAGQLAVSLANAQLYESLEERVAARTRELEQTQAQLVATARRAGRAEIANNVLHNVGNVLNSINVSASIVSRTIGNSRIEGLARAVGLMNEHQGDLARFMGQDPRGKTLLGYLNELVGTLKAERQEALSDLERLARSVEHITYVVATQQSHAGPSSVLEKTRPSEVIEDALRMSAEVLKRHEVSVVRRYEEVPEMALDKQRLLQILVNLIGNAAQAMQAAPLESRQLTLAMEVAHGEGGERLRIAVSDRGEGIAQENLTRIFAHGFTTKSGGHGFGLHSSALAAMEIGAKLAAHSDGPGLGATFTVELPMP